ncbi:MAG: dihydrolipoyl dehydrogenase [Lachnospiraceae bacterium]|nr:dihydrolipoyl dehydrogenase [Lachnospiraceae bacterium]
MLSFDLIVIGGGPGGYPAALLAAKGGLSVALAEEDAPGGTCLHRGCIPTKTLLHSASALTDFAKESAHGILTGEAPRLDMAALDSRRRDVVSTLEEQIRGSLKRAGVRVFAGRGTVTAPGRVLVTAADGAQEELCAKDILIATGASPSLPPIPGADLPGVLTSDTLFDGDLPAPERLTVIGGGVIGVELASFYSAVGCDVTVLEMETRLLPLLEKELGQAMAVMLKGRGVTAVTGARVLAIEEAEGGLLCRYEVKGETREVLSDNVLLSAGRRARTAGLFAEDVPVQIDRGIVVNERFETSVPGIWAVGDVIRGTTGLAHGATAQGEAVAEILLGKRESGALGAVPSCIYTTPEIACAGQTEEAAAAAGLDAFSVKVPMHGNGKTVIEEPGRSFMKLVCEKGTGRILGAELVAARASDMIPFFTAAVDLGLTAEQLSRVIFPHPTFSETMGELVKLAAEKAGAVK